jgi:hypothetical protein
MRLGADSKNPAGLRCLITVPEKNDQISKGGVGTFHSVEHNALRAVRSIRQILFIEESEG